MPCPQGYWCPQAKLQETSSFRQPSPSRQEGSSDWEGESRQENKRLLYFPKRKYIWISIMRGISLKYRKLLNKGSKSQPCSNCQEQYDRWYCCYHHHHLGGTDPVLVHQSQRTQRWSRTWALAGTSFGEVPWGPSPSTGGSSSPLPQMQTETIEKAGETPTSWYAYLNVQACSSQQTRSFWQWATRAFCTIAPPAPRNDLL